MTDSSMAPGNRRRFIAGATAATAGAATLGFPMIAKGQTGPIAMRWQSTWPAKDILSLIHISEPTRPY